MITYNRIASATDKHKTGVGEIIQKLFADTKYSLQKQM